LRISSFKIFMKLRANTEIITLTTHWNKLPIGG